MGQWASPAPLLTFQWVCQFPLQNISSALVLVLKWFCTGICAQVLKSVFHQIQIISWTEITPYFVLLADGLSVLINIMEFRAQSQKFTNSSQHQAKINNVVALELWKGDVFPGAEWIVCLQPKQLLALIVESWCEQAAVSGEMCQLCRFGHGKAVDGWVIPLILLTFSSAHITPCDGKIRSHSPARCDLPLISNPSLHFFFCVGLEGLTLMCTSLCEPQLV